MGKKISAMTSTALTPTDAALDNVQLEINNGAVTEKLTRKKIRGGYKSYLPFLTQSGTNNPSATSLENTLSGVPVWVRDGAAGSYKCTLASEFTIGKTVIIPPSVGNATTVFAIEANYSVNEIYLTTYGGGVAQDDLMGNGISFEIRVYE